MILDEFKILPDPITDSGVSALECLKNGYKLKSIVNTLALSVLAHLSRRLTGELIG